VLAGKWWGDRNVQPVLGLHGWQDNANTFDTLVPLLNVPSFLAIDMMGHGLSSWYPAVGAHHFMDAVIFIRRIVNYFKWTKLSIIGRISSVSILSLLTVLPLVLNANLVL
jgi:pimeloyl-ACP methyl ester carboxylesterase